MITNNDKKTHNKYLDLENNNFATIKKNQMKKTDMPVRLKVVKKF